MNLPPDQLKLRLEAALATIKRLDDVANISEDLSDALCRARYRLIFAIAMLEEQSRAR